MEVVIQNTFWQDGKEGKEYFKESFAHGFTTNWSSRPDGAKVFESEEDAQKVIDQDLRNFPRCRIMPLHPEFRPGDIVFLRIASRSNTARRLIKDKSDPEQYVHSAVVTKVGRLYVYAKGERTGGELRFRLNDLIQEADQQDHRLFRIRHDAIDDIKGELLWASIRQTISEIPEATMLSLKDMETISRILQKQTPNGKKKGA